jgi:hypothetical protein
MRKLVLCFLLAAAGVSAQDQVLALKNQIIDIQNKGTLGFSELVLCSKVMGFGSYVPLEKPVLKKGAELLVYYQPLNVFTNSRTPVFDLFATNTLDITDVPAGSSVYLAVLHDRLKDTSAEYKVPFEISR